MSYFTAQNEQSWVHVGFGYAPWEIDSFGSEGDAIVPVAERRGPQESVTSPPQKPRTVVAWKSLKSASRTGRQDTFEHSWAPRSRCPEFLLLPRCRRGQPRAVPSPREASARVESRCAPCVLLGRARTGVGGTDDAAATAMSVGAGVGSGDGTDEGWPRREWRGHGRRR